MTILRHNLGHDSPQTQVSMGDLGKRVSEMQNMVDGVLGKMKNDLFEKKRKIEEIAVMCEEVGNSEIQAFARILRETGNVNAQDNQEYTILMLVAHYGRHINIINSLFAHPDILVNEKGKRGYAALLVATDQNNNDIVKLLLAHPDILVNEKEDTNGCTALILGAQYGHLNSVGLLLNHNKVLVNEIDFNDHTAFMYAAKGADISIIKLLLADSRLDLREHDQGKKALKATEDEEIRALIEAKMREQGIEV